MLQTDRLLIRPWEERDLPQYLKLTRDVGYHVFSLPGQFMVQNDDEAKAKISERISLFKETGLGKFPIFLKDSGECIGTCGLDQYRLNDKIEFELGYRLCLRYWGKGYATEAARSFLSYGFDALGLPRIIAFAVPQNPGSIRVIEKLGFVGLGELIHAGETHKLYEMRCK